jgi:hypothetical protein
MVGTFSRLPMYLKEWRWPVHLERSPVIACAMKHQRNAALEEMPENLPVATVRDIEKAVELEQVKEIKWLMVLEWVTTARIGDLLGVKSIHAFYNASTRMLKLSMRATKTSKVRQPYPITTVVPPQFAQLAEQMMSSLQSRTHLVQYPQGWSRKQVVEATCLALQKANPLIDNRAVRRGSLQVMAKAGVPDATLMLFSGHKSSDTLQRYLNLGAASGSREEESKAAAVYFQ